MRIPEYDREPTRKDLHRLIQTVQESILSQELPLKAIHVTPHYNLYLTCLDDTEIIYKVNSYTKCFYLLTGLLLSTRLNTV